MRSVSTGTPRNGPAHGRRSSTGMVVAISVGAVLLVAAATGLILLRPSSYSTLPLTPGSPVLPETSTPASVTPGPSATPARTASPTQTACAFPTAGTCAVAPPPAAASGKHWKLSFTEEFNGSDYDHHKLTPCFDWNYGDCTSTFNNGREHYRPSQVVVSNGTAKLIAAPASKPFASTACQN